MTAQKSHGVSTFHEKNTTCPYTEYAQQLTVVCEDTERDRESERQKESARRKEPDRGQDREQEEREREEHPAEIQEVLEQIYQIHISICCPVYSINQLTKQRVATHELTKIIKNLVDQYTFKLDKIELVTQVRIKYKGLSKERKNSEIQNS